MAAGPPAGPRVIDSLWWEFEQIDFEGGRPSQLTYSNSIQGPRIECFTHSKSHTKMLLHDFQNFP